MGRMEPEVPQSILAHEDSLWMIWNTVGIEGLVRVAACEINRLERRVGELEAENDRLRR